MEPNAVDPQGASRAPDASNSDRRLHLSIGAVCNNNCVFCMEEDRDGRYQNNSAMTAERVRWILEQNRGAEEVCFTSGEPTTRPELPDFVKWSRELGFKRISMMTNGRRLSHLPYAAGLAKLGLNRVYISIHGHTQKLHETLTRTPESFAQTVGGLDAANRLKPYGVELHTSTVLTHRNLPHLLEIYQFLRSHGVDQVIFNVMQANGRANTNFEHLFPKYTAIASEFRAFLAATGEREPKAFLVDIPRCTTEGIGDFHRGFVENYFHYDTEQSVRLENVDLASRTSQVKGRALVVVNRSDLDDAERRKRPECESCRYSHGCEGVWLNYLKRYGWDEFVPVPAAASVAGAAGAAASVAAPPRE